MTLGPLMLLENLLVSSNVEPFRHVAFYPFSEHKHCGLRKLTLPTQPMH